MQLHQWGPAWRGAFSRPKRPAIWKNGPVKINLTSVLVDDQDKALEFYTKVLGFIKKSDVPVGKFKWLTVASPEGSPDIELLLEPNDNPAARTFQQAIFAPGYPRPGSPSTTSKRSTGG